MIEKGIFLVDITTPIYKRIFVHPDKHPVLGNWIFANRSSIPEQYHGDSVEILFLERTMCGNSVQTIDGGTVCRTDYEWLILFNLGENQRPTRVYEDRLKQIESALMFLRMTDEEDNFDDF